MCRRTWYLMILTVVVPIFLKTLMAMVVRWRILLQMEILQRTFLHSAARKLKMSTASGRPVFCLHPQGARWQGVVPLPAATLAVLKKLTRAG